MATGVALAYWVPLRKPEMGSSMGGRPHRAHLALSFLGRRGALSPNVGTETEKINDRQWWQGSCVADTVEMATRCTELPILKMGGLKWRTYSYSFSTRTPGGIFGPRGSDDAYAWYC